MSLLNSLQRSRATPAFRAAVTGMVRERRPGDRVQFRVSSPLVKVERTLTRALEAYPHLPIERVQIEAASGCAFYRGTLTLHTAAEEVQVRFDWDCRWRALQEGWTDPYGFPDQARAAREFGHDCFREWVEEARIPHAGPVPAPQRS